MPLWRMNGLCSRTAGLLMLWALLLSSEVTCQDEDSEAGPTASLVTEAPSTGPDNAATDGAADVATSAPAGGPSTRLPDNTAGPEAKPDSQDEDTTGNMAVTVHNVNMEVLTVDNVSSKKAAQETEEPPSSTASSGSSVLVGILVTGLLAALAITVGYFKCQRKSEPKGAKLAEEAYPVDQENQGNTLVSVAPLNPPAETQEKPSINGESTEPAKTEPPPPPTNGHSTTKTADTEL